MHRKEREVHPDELQPEVPLAQGLVQQTAGHLRPPVVDAGEQAQDGAAEQHVVEVRHHVIGVGLLEIGWRRRVRDARQTADDEHRDEADREVQRGRAADVSAPERGDPVEDLHPGGDRDEHGGRGERRVGDGPEAHGEHVMAPHAPAHEPDQYARIDDDGVAEQGLARERRQHLGYDPHGRQDQDVHFGVAENPEEVLPQQGRRAGTGQKEMRAEQTVEHQQEEHDGEDRERCNDDELGDERHPREHGQPHHRHPGRPQVQDGDDEVEPRRKRRDAEYLDAQLVEIDVRPGGKLTLRQIRVGEPAAVRRDAQHAGMKQRPHEPAGVQEQPTEQEHPVAEGVEPRKRHVPGADL